MTHEGCNWFYAQMYTILQNSKMCTRCTHPLGEVGRYRLVSIDLVFVDTHLLRLYLDLRKFHRPQ